MKRSPHSSASLVARSSLPAAAAAERGRRRTRRLRRARPAARSRSASSPTSAGSTTAASTTSRTSGSGAQRRTSSESSERVYRGEVARRTTSRTCRRSRVRATTSTIGVGFTRGDGDRHGGDQRSRTSNFAIVDVDQTEDLHKPAERARPALPRSRRRATSSATSPALEEKRAAGQGRDQLGRRARSSRPSTASSPATRPGAKAADPGINDAERLLAGLRRPGEVQGARAEPDRAGRRASIFQVAGGCGLGALDAAKEKGVWGIGVDADQSFLGPHILTSARRSASTPPSSMRSSSSSTASSRAATSRVRPRQDSGVGHRQDQPEGAEVRSREGDAESAPTSSPARSRTSRQRSSSYGKSVCCGRRSNGPPS